MAKRIWLDNPAEGVVVLDGCEHNHLANVLRVRVGDEITALSGDEFERTYKIENITKKQTVLRWTAKQKNECNPTAAFTVYLAVIKPDNLALVAQKLNEIGATELKLFSSKFCARGVVNTERLNEITRQSCKQCGRSVPLAVSYIGGMDKLVAELSRYKKADVAFADKALSAGPVGVLSFTPRALVVGCEGGFDDDERAAVAAVATPVSLGRRILRAETAAIVGAARWCIA